MTLCTIPEAWGIESPQFLFTGSLKAIPRTLDTSPIELLSPLKNTKYILLDYWSIISNCNAVEALRKIHSIHKSWNFYMRQSLQKNFHSSAYSVHWLNETSDGSGLVCNWLKKSPKRFLNSDKMTYVLFSLCGPSVAIALIKKEEERCLSSKSKYISISI